MTRGTEIGGGLAIVLAAVGACVAVAPSSAGACEAPRCRGGELHEAGGTIPANATGVVWRPRVGFRSGRPSIEASSFELVKVDADGKTPVEASAGRFGEHRVFVVPQNGFEAHTTYRFRGADFCEGDGTVGGGQVTEATFQTGGEAGLSDGLGKAVVDQEARGELWVGVASGSCSAKIDADQAAVGLELTPEMQKWEPRLEYSTEVRKPGASAWKDWSPYLTAEGLGGGGDPAPLLDVPQPGTVLFAFCDAEQFDEGPGLEEGAWEVRMRATMEGRAKPWISESTTVTLSCQKASGNAGADAGASSDAGGDGGTVDPDSGAAGEVGGGDVAWGDPRSGGKDGSGCSSAGRGPASVWWMLVALAAVVRRRRSRCR